MGRPVDYLREAVRDYRKIKNHPTGSTMPQFILYGVAAVAFTVILTTNFELIPESARQGGHIVIQQVKK